MKIRMTADATIGDRDFGKGQECDVDIDMYNQLRQSCELCDKKVKKVSGLSHKSFVKMTQRKRLPIPKTILYIKECGIGNIIYGTSLIQAIKKLWPDCKIDLLVDQYKYKEILKGWNVLRDIYCRDELNNDMSDKPKYDLIINGLPGTNYIHNVYLDGNVVSGNPVWYKEQMHEVEANIKILQEHGCEINDIPNTYMPVSRKVTTKINKEFPKKKYIAICAGFSYEASSFNTVKNWGYEKYADLIIEMNKKLNGYTFLIIGLDREKEVYDVLIRKHLTKRVNVIDCVGKYSIQESAAILKKCEFAVGNDTGMMIVADALGVKAYSIFTATPDRKAKPWNNGNVIKNYIPCSPCYYNKSKWGICRDQKCKDISVDKVLSVILRKKIYIKKKYDLGIIMSTYDRPYMLLATIHSIFESDLNCKDVKITIVNDGSRDNRVGQTLEMFKNRFKGTVDIITHLHNYGKKNYYIGLKEAFDSLYDCEHIMFMPDDFVINKLLYSAVRKSYKYLNKDIKCLSFFRDRRHDKPDNDYDEFFFSYKKYNDWFDVTNGADGFVCVFNYDFLDDIDWNVPSTENRTNVWRHVSKEIRKSGKLLCYVESLGEHIGNCRSMFWPDARKTLKIDSLNLNLFDVPLIVEDKKPMKQAEFEKEFKYSQEWYEKEYHAKGAYHLPERDYNDVMGEWEKAGYKKRLYGVLSSVERYVDVLQIHDWLEVACHHGKSVFWMNERYNTDIDSEPIYFKAFDFSRVAIKWCKRWNPYKQTIEFKHGVVQDMLYTNNRFDFISCLDIAEHLPEKIYFKMINELDRVLKAGGYLLFYCGRTTLPEHINLRSIAQQKEDLKRFELIDQLPDYHLLFRKKR